MWTFKEILDHCVRKQNGESFTEVKVLRDAKEETWELLDIIKAVSKCVEAKDLINKPYWKWAN